MSKKYKNILVDIRGGLGKNIAFGAIVPELRKVYEHVSVISPYSDIFEVNPYVTKVYAPQDARSAIEDAADDTYIVIDHIYDTDEFIRKEISYADAYRKLCGLPFKLNETSETSNDFLVPEKKYPQLTANVQQVLDDLQKKNYKDFILFQHTGGQSPLVQVPATKDEKTGQMIPDWSKVPYQGQNSGLSRHYPKEFADDLVAQIREKHPETAVISYSLPNEPYIEGTERYVIPYLAYYMLAKSDMCKGFIGIDSSLQHLLAGVKKGIVMWHHSLPLSFGYKQNCNLIAFCQRAGIKYFSALGPANNRIDYYSPEAVVQNAEEIFWPQEKSDSKAEE